MSKLESTWHFANSGPEPVFVWLEPWADELILAPGSFLEFRAAEGSEIGEIEQTESQITLWATAEIVQVFIDGKLQETGSAIIPLPPELNKNMLQIVFGNQPSARLGGAAITSETRKSLLGQLRALFGR